MGNAEPISHVSIVKLFNIRVSVLQKRVEFV
jgi:hypothetical protein